MKNLVANLEMATNFLNQLDCDESIFTFQTFDDKAGKNPALVRVFHGTFEQNIHQLIQLNNNGAGIFVMVNQGDGIRHDQAKTCRTAANIQRIRALFVDLDGAPLEPALKFKIAPSMVVQTSPGRYHAYWLINHCPLDQFKVHQQELASQLNGDPVVCDLPRVMRLPGFYHMKREPYLVNLIESNPKAGI